MVCKALVSKMYEFLLFISLKTDEVFHEKAFSHETLI